MLKFLLKTPIHGRWTYKIENETQIAETIKSIINQQQADPTNDVRTISEQEAADHDEPKTKEDDEGKTQR